MSEDLLNKFISQIEQEEGVGDARKRARKAKRDARRGEAALRKERANIQLKAAARGALQLPDEEAYLAKAAPLTVNHVKGVSLIEEARHMKKIDHTGRNKKYLKYTQKLTIAKDKAAAVMRQHSRSLKKTNQIRSDRKKKKKSAGSVFSDKDFESIGSADKKQGKKMGAQSEDGVFL